jgi:hypothetical protein
MTMSERCLIHINHQPSAAGFVTQARIGETAKVRGVEHQMQKCSWIEIVVCEKASERTVPERWKYCMERVGARKAAERMQVSGLAPNYETLSAMTEACNLSARTHMGQSEMRCACSAPAVMWECEYFCSLTGALCSDCTGLRRFSWEAENENFTRAISLAEGA